VRTSSAGKETNQNGKEPNGERMLGEVGGEYRWYGEGTVAVKYKQGSRNCGPPANRVQMGNVVPAQCAAWWRCSRSATGGGRARSRWVACSTTSQEGGGVVAVRKCQRGRVRTRRVAKGTQVRGIRWSPDNVPPDVHIYPQNVLVWNSAVCRMSCRRMGSAGVTIVAIAVRQSFQPTRYAARQRGVAVHRRLVVFCL